MSSVFAPNKKAICLWSIACDVRAIHKNDRCFGHEAVKVNGQDIVYNRALHRVREVKVINMSAVGKCRCISLSYERILKGISSKNLLV